MDQVPPCSLGPLLPLEHGRAASRAGACREWQARLTHFKALWTVQSRSHRLTQPPGKGTRLSTLDGKQVATSESGRAHVPFTRPGPHGAASLRKDMKVQVSRAPGMPPSPSVSLLPERHKPQWGGASSKMPEVLTPPASPSGVPQSWPFPSCCHISPLPSLTSVRIEIAGHHLLHISFCGHSRNLLQSISSPSSRCSALCRPWTSGLRGTSGEL